MYVPIRNALRIEGNVDDVERMRVLTTYKNCMIKSFRDDAQEAARMRDNLKDQLLNGLISANETHKSAGKDDLDLVQSNATYNLCGYLIHTRAKDIDCDDCMSTLSTQENELPSDFYAAFVTSLKSKGFLKFASLGMYYTFAKVERILQDHFKSEGAYMRDSFQQVISEIANDGISMPNICCPSHRREKVPFLIFEYIGIRYHIESKRYKNEVLEKLKEEQHKLRKLSKMVV